jgi:hypothetical protein
MADEAPYPLERAFVVQLRFDAALPVAVCGRVEHVVSGRACRFETAAELAAFVQQQLRDLAAAPGHAPTAPLHNRER